MNIRSVSKIPFTPKSLSEFSQRLFERIPNMTVNREEFFCNVGRVISRPDVGRGIMGATAIVTQPLIDYYNPKVDRDTAKVSTFRTIGKIIAGTAVGCAVRSACYYGTRALTELNPKASGWRKSLLPSERIVQHLSRKIPDWVKNYNSVLATLIGLGAMLFTNVLIDVPLTNLISKTLLNKFGTKDITNPTERKESEINTLPIEGYKPQNIKDKFNDVFNNKFDDRNKWRAC